MHPPPAPKHFLLHWKLVISAFLLPPRSEIISLRECWCKAYLFATVKADSAKTIKCWTITMFNVTVLLYYMCWRHKIIHAFLGDIMVNLLDREAFWRYTNMPISCFVERLLIHLQNSSLFFFFIMELDIEKLVVLEGGLGESAFCLVGPWFSWRIWPHPLIKMATWEALNYKHTVDPSLSPGILFGELRIIGGLGLKLVLSSKKLLQMFQLHPTELAARFWLVVRLWKWTAKECKVTFTIIALSNSNWKSE